MKGATSGKLENMKQSRMTNFFAIPLEKKNSERYVSSKIDDTTEVTQKECANTSSRYNQSLKKWKFNSLKPKLV
jgi:hypothetical protein